MTKRFLRKGITGLETVIVLIVSVNVASEFSFASQAGERKPCSRSLLERGRNEPVCSRYRRYYSKHEATGEVNGQGELLH